MMMMVMMMMLVEAVRISETSVYSNETARRYIPESSHLQEIILNFFSGLAVPALLYDIGCWTLTKQQLQQI
jgi:hypothetical protein